MKTREQFIRELCFRRYTENDDFRQFVHNHKKIHRGILRGVRNTYLFITKAAPRSQDKDALMLYLAYKQYLRAFGATLFEPYCRRKDDNCTTIELRKGMVTTTGQLHFLWWCFVNKNDIVGAMQRHKSANVNLACKPKRYRKDC